MLLTKRQPTPTDLSANFCSASPSDTVDETTSLHSFTSSLQRSSEADVSRQRCHLLDRVCYEISYPSSYRLNSEERATLSAFKLLMRAAVSMPIITAISANSTDFLSLAGGPGQGWYRSCSGKFPNATAPFGMRCWAGALMWKLPGFRSSWMRTQARPGRQDSKSVESSWRCHWRLPSFS